MIYVFNRVVHMDGDTAPTHAAPTFCAGLVPQALWPEALGDKGWTAVALFGGDVLPSQTVSPGQWHDFMTALAQVDAPLPLQDHRPRPGKPRKCA